MILRVVILATALQIAVAGPAKLPSSYKRCKKADAKFNDCVLAAAEDAVHQMAKGIPSLGVPPFDPLFLSELNIGTGKGSTVNVDIKMKNVNFIGFSKAVGTELKADVDNYRFSFKGALPVLVLDGKYEANGRVLILPIRGSGKMHIIITNVTADLEIIGKEIKKDGVSYMDIKDVKFHFEPANINFYFENLLGTGDNKAIGDNINVLLNENWKEILVDLKPGIEDALGQTFHQISKLIFSKVPYKDIFL